MKKRSLALVLSGLMLCAASSACGKNDTVTVRDSSSENTTDSVTFEEVVPEDLPKTVDLRNFDGKNYVTPIKTQQFGDCWSFSLAAAAETSYLFANDMGVPAGEKNEKVDFSEKYVVCYVFNGISDKDVVKGRVRASQVGEGFDASKYAETGLYTVGGPYVHGVNLYGSGFGPVDESVKIKDELPFAYNDDASVKWELPPEAEYRCAATDAILRNSRIIKCPCTFDSDGNYQFNEDGLNEMKWELSQGRALSVSVSATHDEINMDNMASYYTGKKGPDHGVTIVGYDDTFSKEKFTRKDYKGNVVESSIPPKDGAFIVKNSWGLMGKENDINDGYFFLSYYDHSIYSPMSFEFDNTASEKHTARNIDQYDLMMTQWYAGSDYDSETKMANVYDAEEDESLYQISYITGSERTEVKYEIYKDVEGDDPTSGTLLTSGTDCHRFPGSHKVDLDEEYSLKKGNRYSVVLTMRRMTDDEGTMKYTDVLPYSAQCIKDLPVKGVVNKGESYLFSEGKWTDISTIKDSLIEKAHDQGEPVLHARDLPELDPLSKDKYTIDNYPIKAILAPAN